MSGTVQSARAKINLHLHVTGRRADGYHTLDSLAVFAGAADVLTWRPDPGLRDLRLVIEGPFAAGLESDDPGNLVLRAARAIAPDGASGVLTLEKNLPIASGIGGGSSDAAATLRLCGAAWSVPEEVLEAAAGRLGADVPVCLFDRPARMEGIGEILSPAPRLPSCGMVLVNCGRAVSTPAVFAARAPGFRPRAAFPEAWADLSEMVAGLRETTNDLEAAACALCPPILDTLAALRASEGCRFARMSGSGATCFGLYDDADAARRAAATLDPAWWCWAGVMEGVT